jgi:hypothetical protein
MVAACTEYLRHQLDGYGRGWDSDRAQVIAVWELEARLKTALALFEHVRRLDQQMSRELATSGSAWTREAAEYLLTFYRDWEAPTAQIATRIAELQAGGARIESSDEFKRATLEARSVLNVSIEQLERSARDARQGKLRPLAEIRDELRRQADAGR